MTEALLRAQHEYSPDLVTGGIDAAGCRDPDYNRT